MQTSIQKENLFEPEWIYDDPLALTMLKLISVLPRSSKNRETYSSAFVTPNGKILSFGRNMQVKRNENWKVIQGYANHAEMMAFSAAIKVAPELAQGFIYVIGFLSENQIFIHRKKPDGERFTCSLCAKKICEHQINGIALPTEENWKILNAQQTLATAQSFEAEAKRIGKNGARKQEALPISPVFVSQLIKYLKETNPTKLVKLLENSYELSSFVVDLIRASKDGYIKTKNYKTIILRHEKYEI